MIPSAYFFMKYWNRYKQQSPTTSGGLADREISPVVLWQQHLYGELLERAWNVLMRDVMPPDLWTELEAFTRYWKFRRQIYMRRGGPLVTVSGKPRALFTPTGKPRRKGTRPDTKPYDDCIEIAHAKYERMSYARPRASRICAWAGKILERCGILAHQHREPRQLISEQAVVLALSGVISGQIGGRAEIISRRAKAYDNGREEKWKRNIKLCATHLLNKRKSIGARLRHLIHYFSGGRIFLWISKVVYG